MERIDILKKLVELYENGEKEAIEKVLSGISHNELKSMGKTFEALALFTEDAPK